MVVGNYGILIMTLRGLPYYLFPKMSLKKGFFKSVLPFFCASDIQVQDFLVLLSHL